MRLKVTPLFFKLKISPEIVKISIHDLRRKPSLYMGLCENIHTDATQLADSHRTTRPRFQCI